MVKIIIGDSQAIYRAGLARVLALEDDFRVVAQCPDWTRLYTSVMNLYPAIIIVAPDVKPDLQMLLEKATVLQSKIIVIADDSESFSAYLKLGVSGVVYRSTTSAAFLECVHRVRRGETPVRPGPATLEEDPVGTRAKALLSEKELMIVSLLVNGMKNKEIGDKLKTSEQVIKNRLRMIYDKTGVSDRLELALFILHHRVLATAAADIAPTLQ